MTTTDIAAAAAAITEARLEAHAAWETMRQTLGRPNPALRLALLDRAWDIDMHIFWVGMMVSDPQNAVDAVDEVGEILVDHGRTDVIADALYLRAACLALAEVMHQTLDAMDARAQQDVKKHLAEARRRYAARRMAQL